MDASPSPISTLLKEAVNLATKAVTADANQEYQSSLLYYRKSIITIDLLMMKVDEHKIKGEEILDKNEVKRLFSARGQYLARVEYLFENCKDQEAVKIYNYGRENNIVRTLEATSENSEYKTASKNYNVESPYLFQTNFDAHLLEELVSKNYSEDLPKNFIADPPTEPYQKLFWLLKNLINSIEYGGYVTKKLYVPRQVWFQEGCKLTYLEVKQNSFESIIGLLTKLEHLVNCNSDIDELLSFITEFEFNMENIKLTLSRKLNKKEESSFKTSPPKSQNKYNL